MPFNSLRGRTPVLWGECDGHRVALSVVVAAVCALCCRELVGGATPPNEMQLT